MSLPHEIGRLLGAYHEDEPPSTKPLYARAFMHDTGNEPFVTLMGYERHRYKTAHCIRILYFSDPNEPYHGVMQGERGKSNNACEVRAHIGDVVRFGGMS
jgi:hypothetical protein